MHNKPHTKEARAKMSKSRKGVPKSESHRKAMSESMKGKKKSEEHCAQLSIAAKKRQEQAWSQEMIEELMYLKEEKGMSYKAIAEEFGMCQQTISKRYRRYKCE